MPLLIKNILWVCAGVILGMIVNGVIIFSQPYLIPLPEGFDVQSPASWNTNMHLLQPKHFILPWLAHAAGSFVGAALIVKWAKTSSAKLSYIVSLVFLVGGAMNFMSIHAPIWFIILDLVFAYLPMAWLAIRTLRKNSA